MNGPLEQRTTRTVAVRLVPFLCTIACIDRVDVVFAALTMGAGRFLLGPFLFEIPSSSTLGRVGARRWIARRHQGDGLGDRGDHAVSLDRVRHLYSPRITRLPVVARAA